jgi:hypothetical protein
MADGSGHTCPCDSILSEAASGSSYSSGYLRNGAISGFRPWDRGGGAMRNKGERIWGEIGPTGIITLQLFNHFYSGFLCPHVLFCFLFIFIKTILSIFLKCLRIFSSFVILNLGENIQIQI